MLLSGNKWVSQGILAIYKAQSVSCAKVLVMLDEEEGENANEQLAIHCRYNQKTTGALKSQWPRLLHKRLY